MIGRIGWFLVATLADLAMTSGFPLARVSAWHSFPGGGGRRIPLDQRSVPVKLR